MEGGGHQFDLQRGFGEMKTTSFFAQHCQAQVAAEAIVISESPIVIVHQGKACSYYDIRAASYELDCGPLPGVKVHWERVDELFVRLVSFDKATEAEMADRGFNRPCPRCRIPALSGSCHRTDLNLEYDPDRETRRFTEAQLAKLTGGTKCTDPDCTGCGAKDGGVVKATDPRYMYPNVDGEIIFTGFAQIPSPGVPGAADGSGGFALERPLDLFWIGKKNECQDEPIALTSCVPNGRGAHIDEAGLGFSMQEMAQYH